MDFLDPKKKRAHSQRLVLGYILVAVALAMASMIILLRTYGYNLDTKTGTVTQDGLVYVASHPESARIVLNGKDVGNTSTRLTIPAGQHKLELKRDGYRDWSKNFSLEGGSVEQLVYPFMFPTKLVRRDIELYSKPPTFATQSPDKKWLIIAQPNSVNKFDLLDLTNPDKAPTPLILPVSVINKGSGSKLSVVEWSSDNRHVLLRHTYTTKTEFIVLDRQTPTSSINLNKALSTTPSGVTLADSRYDSYYFYFAKSQKLSKSDLKTKVLKTVLSNVISYKTYSKDTVAYITSKPKSKSLVRLRLLQGSESYTIKDIQAGLSYQLALTRYKNKVVLAVATSKAGEVYIFQDLLKYLGSTNGELLPSATTLKIVNPSSVLFSSNDRFISAQKGSKVAVFDNEKHSRYYYDIGKSKTSIPDFKWMDGHRLMTQQNGNLLVLDFDGLNRQSLIPLTSSNLAFFSNNYESLFSISPSKSVPKIYSLSQTNLKVQK